MSVLVAALAYAIIGVLTAELSASATGVMHQGWRLVAWILSALVFVIHVWLMRLKRNQPVRRSALLAALGAGCGGFLLAAAANVHSAVTHTGRRGLVGLALLVWPLAIFIPAFVVALMLATVMAGWTHKA